MEVVHLEVGDPRWREVLARVRHDFYHLPEYASLDGEGNHARPKAYWAQEGDREFFVPYLQRRCAVLFPGSEEAGNVDDVISPYGYPGILLSDAARKSPEFVRGAIGRLSETLGEQGVCSAFLRMNPLLSGGFATLFPENFFMPSTDTVAMDLSLDDARIWKNVRDGHQSTINKCNRLGFVPRMVPFREYIDPFMTIYEETMNRVNARDSYYFGRDYFEKLASMPERVHCCVAELEGHVAAACIFLECGGIVQAHLGGTKSEYLSKSPFHLVLYHVAGWAKSRGNQYLHLGGGVGGSGDRLLHFKRGFSPLLFPFHTLRLITNEETYRQLTALRAKASHIATEEMVKSNYFPAYRSPQ